MEAEDLKNLLDQCPLRIEMNNGTAYQIDSPELIVISDYQAAILVDQVGVKRITVIGLMNISAVIPLGEPAQP